MRVSNRFSSPLPKDTVIGAEGNTLCRQYFAKARGKNDKYNYMYKQH